MGNEITFTVHWLYIPFAVLVTMILGAIAYVFKTGGGDYDFATPLFCCGLVLVLLLVFAIFGGILWW